MKKDRYWTFFEKDMHEIADDLAGFTIDKIYGTPGDGKPIAARLASIMDKPLTYIRGEITKNTIVVDDKIQAGKTDFELNHKKILTIYYKGH